MEKIDPLTDLPNLYHLEQQLDARIRGFERTGQTFGALRIDVDHFGELNEKHGRDFCDRMLRMVGRSLYATCRPYDILGRWGDDEFLGILLIDNEADLAMFAERMRVLVEHSFIVSAGQRVEVTVSIGAAMVAEGDSVDEVIRRADERLNQSKHRGRNHATVFAGV